MPAHMDLLSQTSPEPEVSPEPSVYLHGPETGPADVQLVWRADFGLVPKSETETAADGPAAETEERERFQIEMAALCPPSAAEALAVPLHAVKRWLAQESAGDIADIEGMPGDASSRKGPMLPVLCWRGVDDSGILTKFEDLRPGMTLIVPAELGGCDDWGWNPESKEPVLDIGDAVKALMGCPMLRLDQSLASQWKYEALAQRLRNPDHGSFAEEYAANPPGAGAEPWLAELLNDLQKRNPKWIPDPLGSDFKVAVVSRSGFDQSDSRGSYTGTEIRLPEHLENCGRIAAEFARDLPERLRRTVLLAA
jgi:hypothetical protein